MWHLLDSVINLLPSRNLRNVFLTGSVTRSLPELSETDDAQVVAEDPKG